MMGSCQRNDLMVRISAIINGIFSPPNWGNPCLRERTSRRSGWILFVVTVKKSTPKQGWYCWWQPEIRQENQLIWQFFPLFTGFVYLYIPGGDRRISEPSTVSQQSRSVRLSFCVVLGGLDFGESFLRSLYEFFKRKYSCIRLGEIFLDLSRFR